MSRLFLSTNENKRKVILYMLLDVFFIVFSLLAAICLWYGGTIPGLPGGVGKVIDTQIWNWFLYSSLFISPICILVYSIFHFYSNLWKYATIEDIFKIVLADTVVFILLYLIDGIFVSKLLLTTISKRMLLVAWIVDIILFVFSRSGYRFIKRLFINLEKIVSKKAGIKRVLVVGAGYAGYNVVRSISTAEKGYENRTSVLIVDDDPQKNNTQIMGVRVTHNIENIPRLAEEYNIDEIIVAIPSATNKQLNRIMSFCSKTECVLKMIPPISDISDGGYHVLRDVDIADLLFREEIEIDTKSISDYLTGKTVLVTGGGGSIGSELCRQIAKFSPDTLIIFDIYENNAYELFTELKAKYPTLKVEVRIGSVRDIDSIRTVFEIYKPQVVFHAAAHKHVPLMEVVPEEAVKNNVFGTLNVVKCADEYKSERFVLLSTDKAVNPTNVMGATKRITELIVRYYAQKSDLKIMAVRFGNVLGSNGSVIPLFKEQIRNGGPVTVTDPKITRYFMTIPEASRLVLQAAGLGSTGNTFVLDMGEPVKIDKLARTLIKLSGFVPDVDIKIEYTGLRPGEKLYEELILEEEKSDLQIHNKIFVTKSTPIDTQMFEKQLDSLKNAAFKDHDRIIDCIKELVPNFKPEEYNELSRVEKNS